MTVVLIGAAAGLRGHLTRWLMEVAPGVFVGKVSSRLRDSLWATLSERITDGQAILIEPTVSEQGWAVRAVGVDRYEPLVLDGLIFFQRPG